VEPLDLALLPDFSDLRRRASWEYSIINYIESRGTFELAVAFAKLFWPEFVVRRDCVIRASGLTDEVFESWWVRTGGDKVAVERVLNLLHVRELVPSNVTPLDDSVYRYLGETLADMWAHRVEALFPERRFVSSFRDRDDVGNSTEPTVTLYERS
jgi:hypothetical protein